MDDLLRCAFCGVEAAHDEAIEGGWTPYFFWDEETSCDEPVCPACSARHLHEFEHEPIVRPREDVSHN